MSDVLTKDAWIDRVLGISTLKPSTPAPKQVTFAQQPTIIPPSGPGVRIGVGRQRSGAPINPPPIIPPPLDVAVDGNRTIGIAKGKNGKVLYTAPPPPVKEITFSGGGGKGVALAGAVKALEESGTLKDAKKISGASVGSMTAALVAAGITADEFTEVGNADATTDEITEGTGGTKMGLLKRAMSNKATTGSGNPLTGQGLENVVRDVLDQTLRKRMLEYMTKCGDEGKKPDAKVVEIANSLSGNKAGPTFMNLRDLSKVIPAIKEVVITGTYTEEFSDVDQSTPKPGEKASFKKGKMKELKGGNEEGQLYVFDADSEPNLEVAVAVHASASFPAVFKPVDITLSSGLKVRFIDGGVMNNTPTTSSIGNDRNLDPVPEGRGMTFVFEDKEGTSKNMLKGIVSPAQGKTAQLQDWFLGSDNAGAEYGKNRSAGDRPEEIVEVPLKLTLTPKGGKPKEYDMRDGTLEFNLPMEAKVAFQEATAKATNTQIEREKAPKTREFASDSQMFVSIPLGDLKALGIQGYAGAPEALVFRERTAEMIDKLKDSMKTNGGSAAKTLGDKDATMALDELDTLAKGNVDFQGYVARELNKGGLDTLLDAIKTGGKPRSDVLKATAAVGDALKTRTYADNILKQLIYPQMKKQPEGGTGIEVLLRTEAHLRAAKSPEDLNGTLATTIKHFKTKSDKAIPKRGHKQFAVQLERRMMKAA